MAKHKGIPTSKVFNGHRYTFWGIENLRSDAEARAKRDRKRGFLVRVHKTGNREHPYVLYAIYKPYTKATRR